MGYEWWQTLLISIAGGAVGASATITGVWLTTKRARDSESKRLAAEETRGINTEGRQALAAYFSSVKKFYDQARLQLGEAIDEITLDYRVRDELAPLANDVRLTSAGAYLLCSPDVVGLAQLCERQTHSMVEADFLNEGDIEKLANHMNDLLDVARAELNRG